MTHTMPFYLATLFLLHTGRRQSRRMVCKDGRFAKHLLFKYCALSTKVRWRAGMMTAYSGYSADSARDQRRGWEWGSCSFQWCPALCYYRLRGTGLTALSMWPIECHSGLPTAFFTHVQRWPCSSAYWRFSRIRALNNNRCCWLVFFHWI